METIYTMGTHQFWRLAQTGNAFVRTWTVDFGLLMINLCHHFAIAYGKGYHRRFYALFHVGMMKNRVL